MGDGTASDHKDRACEAAISGGMVAIFRDAMSKVAGGVTSFEEAVRVVREK